MFKRFIQRPVLSTVISVIIVILGILGLTALPIAQYPDIAPPTVVVAASYTGANADVVLKSINVPLEEQINGVENMTYMTSTATNDGSASIKVFFKVGTDPDLAAVNVQNRVSRATSLLPQEVTQAGVTVTKSQSSNLLITSLYSEIPGYDQTFLQNYIKINLIPQIQRVTGVGEVTVFGAKDYAMRIWLKPDVMQQYSLIPSDISAALAEQNIEAAPGRFGEQGDQAFQYVIKYKGRLITEKEFGDIIIKSANSFSVIKRPLYLITYKGRLITEKEFADFIIISPNSFSVIKRPLYVIKYKGRLITEKEFGDIIIKSAGQGQFLRLKDVATVQLDALTYTSASTTNGKASVGFAVSQTPGSNARDVINQSKAIIEEAAKTFPRGIKYTTLININDNLDASIEKVIHTLIEAFILVFIVVFLFLQDFRSTLIPAISVPVAIVGTFFFLNLFGFTINLLTLFALVLAIGIVVDDAIVVVEAVHAKLDEGYTSAKKASIDAMKEISGAIISITLVMAAVFIPVTFIGGSTGVFYKQFGLTLAIAIILSAINALTLSPALCAILLKPHKDDHKHKSFLQRFYTAFNTGFEKVTGKYKNSVNFLAKKQWIVGVMILVGGGALFYMMKTTPSAFVPSEDQGVLFANISLPPSSSLERSTVIAKQVDSIAHTMPEVQNTLRIVGQNFTAGAGSAYSMVIVRLKPWDKREKSVDDIIGQMFGKVAGIREASIFFISPPTLQGFGQSGGFEFQLQDKGGHSTEEFYKVNNDFLAALAKRPEVQYATTSFNPNFPQYMMDVNIEKCKEAGVTINTVLTTMQGYYGGIYASNFNKFGKQYRVMIQALPQYRKNPEDLNNIFVRNAAGAMAPITEFIKMRRVFGAEQISRFNLFTSIAITGAPNPGFSSGDAIKAIQDVAAETLPTGYGYEFSGLTREELASGSETIFIFMLCLVFVYFLLSAQYESYILPFAVLLSLPFGLAGAYLFSVIFRLNSNIYLQISLIMLIGLLAKNGILIVEFALDRRRTGMGILQSAIEGAVARFRPILMTSFAFIFGLMPLMFASGAGAIGNKSIGTGAVGGMLIGTLIGVFVIPVLFVIFQTLQEKISGPAKANYDDDDDDDDTPEEPVLALPEHTPDL